MDNGYFWDVEAVLESLYIDKPNSIGRPSVQQSGGLWVCCNMYYISLWISLWKFPLHIEYTEQGRVQSKDQ